MRKYLFIFMICVNISCSCREAKIATNTNLKKSSKDTIYVKTDSTIILESLYLNLDSIKYGDAFTNKEEQYGFYRLLFSTCEETQSIYAEKINIIGDGIVKFKQRIKLTSELFNKRIKSSSLKFVSWETSEIIKIKLDSTIIHVNLTSIFKQNR